MRQKPSMSIVDRKSLCDHVVAATSPVSLDDRRCAIDVLTIRESLRRMSGLLCWAPGDRMLADALTKNKGDPAGLLSSCMRLPTYQLSDESDSLEVVSAELGQRSTCDRIWEQCPPARASKPRSTQSWQRAFANLLREQKERPQGDPRGDEKVAFGSKMRGQTFEEAYLDQGWVAWTTRRGAGVQPERAGRRDRASVREGRQA